MELKVGDLAPDFSLRVDEKEWVSLGDFRGKKVLLYFYPKDSTPHCTREACDFRDSFERLQTKNTTILGVSRDDLLSHKKFKQKHTLPFLLLADEEGRVSEQYGVVRTKSLFKKTFLGIERSSFLIDEVGIIRAIWRKVKVTGHIQQVIDELDKT